MLSSILVLSSLVVFLTVIDFGLDYALPDRLDRVRDIVSIVQSSVTALAIAGGALFAVVKLQAFRDFEPHLTVKHEISHRLIGSSYIHVGVNVFLHNSSKVVIKLQRGEYLLQRISPITDVQIEELFIQLEDDDELDDDELDDDELDDDETDDDDELDDDELDDDELDDDELDDDLDDDESNYIEWPVRDAAEREWAVGELLIEPGESHQEVFESIIPRGITTILIYTYFSNPTFVKGSKAAQGWSATSFYDLNYDN